MIKVSFAVLLATSAFGLVSSTVSAQVIFGPGMQGVTSRSNPGGVHERTDLPVCQTSGGGTRIRRANCEPEESVASDPAAIRLPPELTLPIEPPNRLECTGTVTTEYLQRNTLANVNSTLEVSDCAAASGALTIRLRVRDESGENKSLEFIETWERSDGHNVTIAADYPIGENVELLNLRVLDVQCTCADSEEE